MSREKRLSESTADEILAMITVDRKFNPGDKLPNENELSEQLQVSRTTLREAVRILATNGVLEIKRGTGTFVCADMDIEEANSFLTLSGIKVDARDLYEMRLIFEPEAAYYAAMRATDAELEKIVEYGNEIEKRIQNHEDRTEVEQKFHKSIAKATHNEFMNQLMPVIYQAINKGVALSAYKKMAVQDTVSDHRMIMEFIKAGNPEGARSAMKIHILHAMKELHL